MMNRLFFFIPYLYISSLYANAPISLTAKSAVFSSKDNTLSFSGDAKLSQNQSWINAENITAFINNRKIEKAIATGTRYKQAHYHDRDSKDQVALDIYANRITFNQTKNTILFSGNVLVYRGNNQQTSENVEYNLTNKNITSTAKDKKVILLLDVKHHN